MWKKFLTSSTTELYNMLDKIACEEPEKKKPPKKSNVKQSSIFGYSNSWLNGKKDNSVTTSTVSSLQPFITFPILKKKKEVWETLEKQSACKTAFLNINASRI